jgi:TPR repeat protein
MSIDEPLRPAMRYCAKLLLVTLMASLLTTSVVPVNAGPSDDWNTAFDAFKRSDYATALTLFRSLAEQGYAGAQFQLGFLYRNGWGAPQDYAEALKWLRRAAAQGNSYAQSNLGFMYRDGEGVQKDYVQAHIWFNLAAAAAEFGKENLAAEYRDELAKKMTPAQIAEAQKLAREWKPQLEQAPLRALR